MTMKRKITPEIQQSIREAREAEGLTLTELEHRFPFSRSTLFTVIRGCDDSNVKWASPNRRVVQPVQHKERPSLSKVDIGEASRQMICARLMLAGVKVFRPMTEDTPIDLLILTREGRILKCQCKYVYPQPRGCHLMNLYATRQNSSTAKKHKYTEKEVDFFLGYCNDNDAVYVIPFSATGGRSQFVFWVSRPPRHSCPPLYDTANWKNAFQLLQ